MAGFNLATMLWKIHASESVCFLGLECRGQRETHDRQLDNYVSNMRASKDRNDADNLLPALLRL
jgi:hypothetical protein